MKDAQESYSKHFESGDVLKNFSQFKEAILPMEIECAEMASKHILIPKKQINIFEIGFGDGRVTSKLLSKLQEKYGVAEFVGVDISKELVESCKKVLSRSLPNIELSLMQGDLAEYTFEQKYDLILSINSMYGVSFDKITEITRNLTEGGVFAIILNSGEGITMRLAQELTDEPIINSEMLMDYLKEKEIDFEAIDLHSDLVNKELLMKDDEIAAEGFFRYILRRSTGSLGDVEELLQSKPESFFSMPQHLILIRRQ